MNPEQILNRVQSRSPFQRSLPLCSSKYLLSTFPAAYRDSEDRFALAETKRPAPETVRPAAQKKRVFYQTGYPETASVAQPQFRGGTSPIGYLEGIYVKEADRGKGIARRLLRACEDWARGQGCTEFASDCELTNTDSQGFHRAVGFDEANRIVAYVRKI